MQGEVSAPATGPGIPAFVFMALLAGGCASDASPPSPFAVVDSAGVRVVSQPAGAFQNDAVVPEPVYRHGHGDGDYTFSFVVQGALQADGSAFVADVPVPRTAVVVRVGPEGPFEVVAPTGEGPGEVRSVLSLHALGQDSLWIEDDLNGRISLLGNGREIRSVGTLEDRTLREGLRIVELDENGRFLMVTSSYDPRFTEPWLQGQVVRFDPASRKVDSVASFDLASRTEGPPTHPFGAFGTVAGSGGHVVHGRSDRPEVVWRDGAGAVHQIVRWTQPVEHPTETNMEQFFRPMGTELARINPGLAGPALDDLIRSQRERFVLDPTVPLPFFTTLTGDDQGGVWLAEWTPNWVTWPSRYQVISPDGEGWTTVEFPTPVRILDVRGDLVLGVVRDSMDVQAVEIYRVDTDRGG